MSSINLPGLFSMNLQMLADLDLGQNVLVLSSSKKTIEVIDRSSVTYNREKELRDLECVAKAIDEKTRANPALSRVPENLKNLKQLQIHLLEAIQETSQDSEEVAAKKTSIQEIIEKTSQFLAAPSDEQSASLNLETEAEQFFTFMLQNPNLDDNYLETISSILDQLPAKKLTEFLNKAAKNKSLDLIVLILKTKKIDRRQMLQTLAGHQIETEQVIMIGKKIEDPKLLENFVDFYHDSFERGSSDLLFYDHFSPKSLEQLKQLFEAGYPIRPNTIKQAFFSGNYPGINLMLQYVSDEWLKANANEVLSLLMRVDDPRINALMLKQYPAIFSSCPLSLLKDALRMRQAQFVESVLKNGRSLTPDELKELLPLAKSSQNLMIMKTLSKCADPRLNSYSDFFELDRLNSLSDKKDLFNAIIPYAIMSPLPCLFELGVLYPHICSVLPEILETTGLLVRFPNTKFTTEVNPMWRDISKFCADSVDYAERNNAFLKSYLPKLKNSSRSELLDAIIQNRYERMIRKNNDYLNKQITDAKFCYTPLFTSSSNTIFNNKFITHTNITRYAWSLRHLGALYLDEEKMESFIPERTSISSNNKGRLTYSYTLPSGEHYATTVLDNASIWEHTDAKPIRELQAHLEKVHEELLNCEVDLSDPSSKQEFDEKVAQGYWLIATLCETHRGTPHNAMMWLNLIYAHHALPTPIPKIPFFFLDNLALMIPVEIMVRDWSTFFELPLDQSLPDSIDKEAALQVFLETNGLLLRECSREVRGNKSLVAAAVRQNPEAMKFASKSLQTDPELIALCQRA